MLPSEIASSVRRIQVVTGRQVAEVMAGAWLSVFKGRGMEFDEVRPYVPGDDVRTIDWNVTARTGEPHVKRYAVDLVAATRDPKGAGLPQLAALIDNGASVRGSIALIKVAKAHALLAGRSYISPHDVKTVAHDVLRHRVLPSYEAEAQGKTTDHLVEQILENVPVP